MDKEAVRSNKQKALIQDTLRAALKESQIGDSIVLNPFIISIQTLKREISFMEPFLNHESFSNAINVYESSLNILEKAEKMIIGENEVTNESAQILPLIDYHSNLLKIHRLLITRLIDDTSILPPAPPPLQKQVGKAFEAIEQLNKVVDSLTQIPKVTKARKIEKKPQKKVIHTPIIEESLELIDRVSPFITEGNKKSTVSIDGIIWPRYV